MPLQNFGSILNFAADLEAEDRDFYTAASTNPECAECKSILEEFARNAKRNERTMRDTCREHVCEMILEPIIGLTRQPFLSVRDVGTEPDRAQVLTKALELEAKAERFYCEAATKISAIPEVSRVLARAALRRTEHRKKIEDFIHQKSD